MNPVSVDSDEFDYRAKKIRSEKEQVKYYVECFLFGNRTYPTIEEIEQKKRFFSQYTDLENAPAWFDSSVRMYVKRVRKKALKELNRQTSLGFNPYQE